MFVESKVEKIRDNALISSVLETGKNWESFSDFLARTAAFAYLTEAKKTKAGKINK